MLRSISSIPTLLSVIFVTGALIKRAIIKDKKENQKKIKIVLRHAGNQPIPEFYTNNFQTTKSISIEVSENSSIAEVKDKIAKKVKYADRTSSLFVAPFGELLQNSAIVKDVFKSQQDNNRFTSNTYDPLYLYFVIPNY